MPKKSARELLAVSIDIALAVGKCLVEQLGRTPHVLLNDMHCDASTS